MISICDRERKTLPNYISSTTPRTNMSVNGTIAIVKKILTNFFRIFFTTAVVPFTLVLVCGVVLQKKKNII